MLTDKYKMTNKKHKEKITETQVSESLKDQQIFYDFSLIKLNEDFDNE